MTTAIKEPVLSLTGISKEYGNNLALQPIDFALQRGEVHVLFGENGAGKSTLISIIAGANQPSSGQLSFDGQQITIKSVNQARAFGICAVFQEFSLVEQLSVADNIFLGQELSHHTILDRAAMNRRAGEILSQLDFELTPEQNVGELPRAGQQMVEIAKAFCGEVKVLILDEPTASLTDHETNKLFALLDKLKSQGVAIVYITHRMAEIRRISDRVTVLRDGHVVGQLMTQDLSEDSLVEMMTGDGASAVFPRFESTKGEVIFRVNHLSASNGLNDVSLEVRQGEIVGLAGLIGCGKSELAQCCYGITSLAEGEIEIDGHTIKQPSPQQLIAAGLYYCPPDRRDSGLILSSSIAHNLTINALKTAPLSYKMSHVIKGKNEQQCIDALVEKLHIKASDHHQLVATLSGGNQQKVLIAKALSRQFKVFVFDEPTVGVDIKTRKIIYQFISELCQQGAAILLISSDLPEIINLSHRCYVFSHGKIAAHLQGNDINEHQVLSHFFSDKEHAA